MVLFVIGIVALVALLFLSIITALAFRPSGFVEFILWTYITALAVLLVTGYTLSVFHLFGTLWAWSATILGLLVLGSVTLAGTRCRFTSSRTHARSGSPRVVQGMARPLADGALGYLRFNLNRHCSLSVEFGSCTFGCAG